VSNLPRAPPSSKAVVPGGQYCDSAALAGNAKPDRRLDEVRSNALQECRQRVVDVDAVRAGGRANRDAIRAVGWKIGKARLRPRRSGMPRRAALFRHAATANRPGPVLQPLRHRCLAGSTASFGEQNRVVPARSDFDELNQPVLKAFQVMHEPVVDGAFEPVAVAETA
jgi:hypothetical protein